MTKYLCNIATFIYHLEMQSSVLSEANLAGRSSQKAHHLNFVCNFNKKFDKEFIHKYLIINILKTNYVFKDNLIVTLLPQIVKQISFAKIKNVLLFKIN
jgi:hypothetical protein